MSMRIKTLACFWFLMNTQFLACWGQKLVSSPMQQDIIAFMKPGVLREADLLLAQQPVTITQSTCPRSAGTIHDYYSEGDYWWPDPDHPDGPYIQKDGLSNPDNFQAHRLALRNFSKIAGTLTSAYVVTRDQRYVQAVTRHLRAWLIDTTTRMNPHLQFSQAISGRNTGRGIGIIDGIFLIDVARSVYLLEQYGQLTNSDLVVMKQWFADFLHFLTKHPFGIAEMNWENNHGTWWHTQAAAFAQLTNNREVLALCKNHLETDLLPRQMRADGGFPLELKRTKPLAYSQFNLEGMMLLSWILSMSTDHSMKFQLPDGRSLQKGVAFIAPYIQDKSTWPYAQDISYWDEQPNDGIFLMLAAVAYQNPGYLTTWKQIDRRERSEESKRNQPIKSPLLWLPAPPN